MTSTCKDVMGLMKCNHQMQDDVAVHMPMQTDAIHKGARRYAIEEKALSHALKNLT
jgi:hypothetical protein